MANKRSWVTGDIDVPFVEQASITAGGTVIIRKQAYYSRVFAGGDIHCQEGSKVMGGIIMAGRDIGTVVHEILENFFAGRRNTPLAIAEKDYKLDLSF